VILQRENYKQYNILFIHTTSATQLAFTQRNEKYYYDVNLVGGDIELKVFLGATPEQAIQKYHHHIGGFQVPPFWAMGYHQCRWGYNNIKEVYEVNCFIKVLNKFEQNDIPLEAFWLDIDYME
jgi:alpha-glucosidase (family GH31 glycosyl hydrolase)